MTRRGTQEKGESDKIQDQLPLRSVSQRVVRWLIDSSRQCKASRAEQRRGERTMALTLIKKMSSSQERMERHHLLIGKREGEIDERYDRRITTLEIDCLGTEFVD